MRKDAIGYFYFVDRIGDTFRWKGENVATSRGLGGDHRLSRHQGGERLRRARAGTEGRAGMAALVADDDLDLDGLRPARRRAAAAYRAADLPAHPAGDRHDLDLQAAQGRPGEAGLRSAQPPATRSTSCTRTGRAYVPARLRRSTATSARARCGCEQRERHRAGRRRRVLARRPGRTNGSAKDDGLRRAIARALRRAAIAEAAAGKHDDWAETPEGALALMLLLDQFSRNMFRGSAEGVRAGREGARRSRSAGDRRPASTGRSSRRCAASSTCRSCIRRRLPDQERCVVLCHALGEPRHLCNMRAITSGIIRRFGRFPHRNTMLGRHTTPAEQAFLDGGGFTG